MSHPAHKIAGPMLRTIDPDTGHRRTPATPQEVNHALTYPRASVSAVVRDEWVNEAKRKNGMSSSSAVIGRAFRADQELRRRAKSQVVTVRLSRLQRIARRITRLFRKH